MRLAPKRGLQGAAHEDAAVGGDVAQDDAFAVSGKQHVMFPNDIPAANGGKADAAAFTRTGDAVAARDFGGIEIDPPPCGSGLAQHQRRAGGGIDLHAVMRLDDFYIPVCIQRCGDFLCQTGQQVDAKAHIAGLNDHGMVGGGIKFGVMRRFKAGGSHNMHGAGLSGEGGKFHRGSGGGEIDHRLRCGEGFERVIADQNAKRSAAHADADILANPGMAGAFDATCQLGVRVGGDALDQHLTHAARGSGDDDSGDVGHVRSPILPRLSGFAAAMKARRCGRGRIGVNGGMANTRSYSAKGPSQRQLRVGELIRRTLSEILARGEVHDPVLNDMSITVGEVSVSVDLKVATVYVMPLMGGATVEQAIAALARNAWELRKRVSAEMTLRHSPELRFRPDDTFDRLEEARRLFADPKVQADIAKPADEAPEASE